MQLKGVHAMCNKGLNYPLDLRIFAKMRIENLKDEIIKQNLSIPVLYIYTHLLTYSGLLKHYKKQRKKVKIDLALNKGKEKVQKLTRL
jgi:hypothetical protein